MRGNKILLWVNLVITFIYIPIVWGQDLREIKENGVIRHLGVPYARFVTGGGDGLDVEIIQLFAKELGVEYQYVKTSWNTVVSDLIGKNLEMDNNEVKILGKTKIRGDIIGNGFTILPWRQQVLNFSNPYFPTQVWAVTQTESKLRPIKPSGSTHKDITLIKAMLEENKVMGKKDTCLDPRLYNLNEANILLTDLEMNELGPGVSKGVSEIALLDVATALVDLQKYPGKLKILGPISEVQSMGFGIPKSSPELQVAFTRFLNTIKQKGIYLKLVKKYYPGIDQSFPEWFDKWGKGI